MATVSIWLLLIITSADVHRISYGSKELCEQAAKIINEQSKEAQAVCIPADPYSMLGDGEGNQQ